MKFLILAALCSILMGCRNTIDVQYIKNTGWSHESGFRITDFINFKQEMDYSISGDTIFMDNKPKAIIIGLNKGKYDLTIKSLDDNIIGHYTDERAMYR